MEASGIFSRGHQEPDDHLVQRRLASPAGAHPLRGKIGAITATLRGIRAASGSPQPGTPAPSPNKSPPLKLFTAPEIHCRPRRKPPVFEVSDNSSILGESTPPEPIKQV